VVTDLSPRSGVLTYRPQLLAIRQLLEQGITVRSLPRLHAKVLLIDGTNVTVGSQNFTSYARDSKETTVAAELDVSESHFGQTLQRWYEMAEPVELELIERLLDELAEPLQTALAAIETLSIEHEKVVAGQREIQRLLAQQRFERAAAAARGAAAAAAMQRVSAASPYSPVGQSVACARLKLDGAAYYWTLEAEKEVDLTFWRGVDASGQRDEIELERLYFYPVLLGPGMRMAFARVTIHRITYVSRGIYGGRVTVKDIPLRFTITFPDDDPGGANLVVTFHQRSQHGDDDYGYEVRLLFDGEHAERITEGPIGNPPQGDWTPLVQATLEDPEEWGAVLRAIFAPTRLTGFIAKPNAHNFFPRKEWLRITPIRFAGRPVLLMQQLDSAA